MKLLFSKAGKLKKGYSQQDFILDYENSSITREVIERVAYVVANKLHIGFF